VNVHVSWLSIREKDLISLQDPGPGPKMEQAQELQQMQQEQKHKHLTPQSLSQAHLL
jgi:hypothetical protein